jgi:hypothetical protein
MPPTIIVDPEGSSQSGERLPAPGDFKRRTTLEQLADPLHVEADPYVMGGKPYLVYPMWDYAEDWSGEYLGEIHPFAVVLGGKKISEAEWRELVVSHETKP